MRAGGDGVAAVLEEDIDADLEIQMQPVQVWCSRIDLIALSVSAEAGARWHPQWLPLTPGSQAEHLQAT